MLPLNQLRQLLGVAVLLVVGEDHPHAVEYGAEDLPQERDEADAGQAEHAVAAPDQGVDGRVHRLRRDVVRMPLWDSTTPLDLPVVPEV